MAFIRDIAISTLVTLLFYVLVIECQTPAQQPLTAARPALVRSGKQKPNQIKVEKETLSFNVGDLATVVKETLTDNDIGIADHGDDNDDEIMKQVEEADKNYEEYLEAKINKTKNRMNKPTRRKKQPTRRNVPYFTAHFRHCIFIKDYCQEACFGAVKNVCRRFKCSRNASQELVLACKNCNISYIRNFPRQRLIYTDFMKRNQKVKFVNRGNFSKNYEVPIVEEKDRKRKRPKIGRHHPGDDNDSKDSGETKKKHKHKGLASDEEWYVFPPDDLLKTLKKTSNVSKTPKPGSKAKKNLSKNESASQDPDTDISYFYKSEEQEEADGQYFVDETI